MTQSHDPDALARLLPFYVNGTLDPVDRAALDAALESSAELREALRAEQLLQARHREGLAPIPAPTPPAAPITPRRGVLSGQ